MNLQTLLFPDSQPDPLLDAIRRSPSAPTVLAYLRALVPDLGNIPQTTYTLYREFERSGERDTFQKPYFAKRARLTRAVAELICGDESVVNTIHDLLWNICEETTWVLPAHEEQGPDFWDLKPSPRTWPWGTNTMLTREPDSIDLFAAETGASLAETIHLIGDRLAPEVVQRVRQEVERHIFKPYLAYGRKHWWHKGALNWNGVCNGAIGLAFLRLEKDPRRLAEALEMVLEGFEAYIATGFEADGGSIEGPAYWGYGTMYFTALAEALRQRTNGQLDLLAAPRMKDVARYPLSMALSPGIFVNFGDAPEEIALQPGIVQRLSERTGVTDLRRLLLPLVPFKGHGVDPAKLAIVLRDFAWWDGETLPFPESAQADVFLPSCGEIKLNARTPQGQPVTMAAKAGHNDGHHSHTDVGHFIVHVAGESLLCDPARGVYSREYFRQQRYQNLFCNSRSHSVPRFDGQLQMPGPEFGGKQQYHGQIVEHGQKAGEKFVVIDFHAAYELPALKLARRRLTLAVESGAVTLEDVFDFEGEAPEIEEGFVTWGQVEIQGAAAILRGKQAALRLTIQEPAGAAFTLISFEAECRANKREGVLKRLSVTLPAGARRFCMSIAPTDIGKPIS